MSAAAPVVTLSGPNTSSSATRPPYAIASRPRQREGDAERAAPRHDRDLMERVEPRHLEADQRVPGLVVGRQAPLLLGEHHTLALEPEHQLVLGVLEVD